MAARNYAQNLWHVTASEAIKAEPLTSEVTADLIIIGGGFTGCSAALHAAELGARVVLLEAHVVGHGASGRNVGLVNAGLWTPPDEVEAILGKSAGARLNETLAAGPATVASLIEAHDIVCDARHAGTLHLAHSRSGLKDLQSRFRQHKARHAPVSLLDADETARRTGSASYRGALFDQRAFVLQPYSYCRGLARAAMAAGANIREASRVVSVARDGGSWVATTDRGKVTAPLLINATDSYHDDVAGMELPKVTRAGYFQVATRPLPQEVLKRILPGGEGCWDTATVMSSFRLDRHGRLLVGAAGSLSHAGTSIHTNWAHRKMVALFPFLRDETMDFAWYGTIGMTGDHLPRIVRIGENALAAFGYSGRGIAPGTVFGKTIARYMLGNDPDALPIEPTDAHSERFTGIRGAYYETGSAAAHFVANRFN